MRESTIKPLYTEEVITYTASVALEILCPSHSGAPWWGVGEPPCTCGGAVDSISITTTGYTMGMTERERELWSHIKTACALLMDAAPALNRPGDDPEREWREMRDRWMERYATLPDELWPDDEEEGEASAVKDAAPPGGTLERKIWNTVRRREANGKPTSVHVLSDEHQEWIADIQRQVASSRFLTFGAGEDFQGPQWWVVTVEPDEDDVTQPDDSEPQPADPPAEVEKLPLHVALLEDVRRWSAGEPWLPVEAYPRPREHYWGRRRDWPECLLNGASRNMAVLALFLRLADAVRRGDKAAKRDCEQDAYFLVSFERLNGFDIEEAWGEYLCWNKFADVGLLWTMQDPGLRNAMRAQAAVWRLMLPGTPEQPRPITVRNDRGKVVYHGFGSRNPGGRELPKSEHQLHAGLGDAIFAQTLGYEWSSAEYDNQRTPESQILKHFLAFGMVPDFSDLRDFDTAVEVAKGYRPHRPFVIERYVDGSVVAWFEQALSSQTGTLFAAWQLPDGEGYHYLFPYPKDVSKVREGWAKKNGGSLKAGTLEEVRLADGERFLECRNGVEERAEYFMPLPRLEGRTHRWRWSL